jgi:predicted Zn-dependent protease
MFSGRTVALPDLHTIGACTGRIVTMVSPAGRGIRKGFNWGRVMRHELVHIFNLEQTNFLVPHWFTEGLAVENEGFARPQSWNELLRERVPAGKLMNLDDIDLGFMRPRNPLDWHMAYCQSQLYVQYIKKTYKEKAIGEMLAAFRDGLSTAGAIQRVCGVDKAAFEKGYRAFLEAEVKKIAGGGSEKQRSLDELRAAHEKDPGDLDTAAELAEAVMGSDAVKARELAEKVRGEKPDHPVACIVLARLARRAGDVKQERELLEKARKNNKNPHRRVLLMLGKIYYDASEYDNAAEVLEQGRSAEPGNTEWLDLLGKVYAQKNDREKLIGVLKELIPTDADDLDRRKRLARLMAEDGNHAGAEQYAREALEINVTDAEVHEVLLKALREQGKDVEAERLAKLLQ